MNEPKQASTLKVVLIVLGVLIGGPFVACTACGVGVAALGAAGASNRPRYNNAPTRQTTASGYNVRTGRTTERAAPAPVQRITVGASTLIADYRANEVAASGRYLGKNLKVTGTVRSISLDFMDDVVVNLRGSGLLGIQASVADSSRTRASNLGRGDTVTLLCEGGPYIIGTPTLSDCTIQ
jgi:hypothetical protein